MAAALARRCEELHLKVEIHVYERDDSVDARRQGYSLTLQVI